MTAGNLPSVKPTPLERAVAASPAHAEYAVPAILAAALSDEDEMVRVVSEAIASNYAQPRGLASDIAAAVRAYLLGEDT